jgi:hypothetical protein
VHKQTLYFAYLPMFVCSVNVGRRMGELVSVVYQLYISTVCEKHLTDVTVM